MGSDGLWEDQLRLERDRQCRHVDPADPDKIIYYFAEYQPMFDKYSHVDFRQGVPKSSEIEDIRSEQDEDLRLRTHIFPSEGQIVYVSK